MNKKTAVITGAAGQIGLALSKRFVAEGYNVLVADVTIAALKNTYGDDPSAVGIGRYIEFDVSNPLQVTQVFEQLHSSGIDVMVNNAGIGIFTSFWERDFAEFMKVLEVNVGGCFLCSREAAKIMARKNGGSIINIGSIYGQVSSDPRIYTDSNRINSEVYSASKAAVIQMTKYFSVHLAKHKIRVNCVSPGGVFNSQGDDFVKNYSYRTPLERMANPDEIAEAVLYFASNKSNYITGQNLTVDGGFTAW